MKHKATIPVPAQDLYISTLFKSRRAFVSRSCDEWWILSAEHGLVSPDRVLAPYDLALKSLGREERRQWSRRVLEAIDREIRPVPGDCFEIHAGAEYRDFGVVDGLHDRQCDVTIPTLGMGIGVQLRFYKLASDSA